MTSGYAAACIFCQSNNLNTSHIGLSIAMALPIDMLRSTTRDVADALAKGAFTSSDLVLAYLGISACLSPR